MAEELKTVNEEDLKQLKERMNIIADADPDQYHNDYSLRRYLRAFKTVDNAFQVCSFQPVTSILHHLVLRLLSQVCLL